MFFVYQVFEGLLSFNYASARGAHPSELSVAEIKMWRENTVLSAGALLFALMTRIVGIAWLIRLGFRTEWHYPVVLFLGSLLPMAVTTNMIRGLFGPVVPAMLGFIVLPIAGVALWVMA